MRISVEAWSPERGAEADVEGPDKLTDEPVDIACEGRPWEAVDPADIGALADAPLVFVDGTRRIDARVYLSSNGEAPVPGLAGSVGVGAVECDPAPPGIDGRKTLNGSNARRARIVELNVDRFLAAGNGTSADLTAGAGLTYSRLPVPGYSLEQIEYAIHDQMRAREAELARALSDEGRLVFLDGPLAVMRPGPQTIVGILKSHHKRYLDDDAGALLGKLGCGQRTPLFAFGEPRPRYSWYLRLCELDEDAHSWHGLVRCEAPAALPKDTVVRLADASAALLPAFASKPYWDPRAPQNLVPVAGLEKRMRHYLGDRNLVYRMIRSAARRASEGAA